MPIRSVSDMARLNPYRTFWGVPRWARSASWCSSASRGFFITRSFEQKHSLTGFLGARALRLFPALAVVLAVTVAVSAVFFTVAPPQAFWPEAGAYFLRNLFLFFPKYTLPGVFETNPYGQAINGSLWTLSYEVLCYLGVVICGVLGVLGRRAALATVLLMFMIIYASAQVLQFHTRIENLIQLALPFVVGMSFWVWRAVIPLSWTLVAGGLIAATVLRPTPLFDASLVLVLAYGVFVLGYARIGFLGRYTRFGDYSYGTYVYAFPLQQVVASLGVVSPLANMTISFPAVLVCAVLSWRFVEAPALRLRSERNVRVPRIMPS
jgi:peptidoglycan/LPS O-acetylase OafA/YrhL